MRLKSIEINGFKSFANKIVFEFPHGITGIVGPNGSGKSNIGDAVRWVLGEQSARQLRGSRMEDVIFSGTENRRPLGFAYVAIVFDNTDRQLSLDYDEVKVARRVYRSGESEYLINGSVCRRKDIVEIFFDTGIGKEGYSIIGQGQVEKILSGKIEDSRELFDEAAGIAKYKKNRTVTEKSLEQERQNLERVTDILNELSARVGPLEIQSKKAKEYLALKEQEKDLDIHLFLYDYEQLSAQQSELERQQAIVERDLTGTRTACEEIKEKNTALHHKTEELSAQADRLNAQKEEEQEKMESLRQKKQEFSNQQESNCRFILHYEEQESKDKTEKTEKETLLKDQEAEEEQIKVSLAELKEELLDSEDALTVLTQKKERLMTMTAGERDKLFSLMSSSADIKEKLSRYIAMEEQLQIRNAEYNSRLLTYQSEKRALEERTASVKREFSEAGEKASLAMEACHQAQKNLMDCQEEEKKQRHQLEQTHQEFLRARSRYETLRNISERYDGYQQSIRQVMEQKKNHPGLIGVVADILTLDKKYETAIEIALGGALQNIVTEDDATAKAMISFLKKNRLGRATFLPLTNIRRKNTVISPRILEEEGVIGTADRLVSVDKKFENLVMSLLGRTIVVDHIDHALYLSKKNNFSIRIVTLDGELLNPGGAITGGAFRHSGNLLGRKREVEECQSRMNEAEKVCEGLKSSLASLKEKRKSLEEETNRRKEELEKINLLVHDYEKQLPELSEKEKEINNGIRSLKESHDVLSRQLADIRIQKDALNAQQENKEKSHEENNDLIGQLEEQIRDTEENIRQQEEEKNSLVLEISKKEQQQNFCRSEYERLQNELKELTDSIEQNRQKRKELQETNEQLKKETAALEEIIDSHKKELTHIHEELSKIKEKQKEISSRQQAVFSQLEETNERLLTLEKENTRITNRLEKSTELLDNSTNYMWETYEITYNYALALKKYDIRPSEVGEKRREQKEIRQKIRQLGNVNVNAIEEYREVGERYEFLKGQYEDIRQAEENLVVMIDDLNAAMKEQFIQKFEEIRSMFQKVFCSLFEGGQADLEIMDESNILECGIRICAQPPGKKLQNIMLLSGGERALTAISLLFAIQQLKPSPFCLLDEIEAALDEPNIVRFSRYLKQLSKDTQFIVITHRRGTMTAADALYGITMQEKGVSTLISVDLIDAQLDA